MAAYIIAILLSFGLSLSTIESTDWPPEWNEQTTSQEIQNYIVEDDVDGG